MPPQRGWTAAGEGDKGSLQHDDTTEVDRNQHHRERSIDQRAVDDEIYVVEPIMDHRYPYGDRESWEPLRCSTFYLQMSTKNGADERTRTADLISLRVCLRTF
jgi:hypothetical protein